jgi:hypothetical protein
MGLVVLGSPARFTAASSAPFTSLNFPPVSTVLAFGVHRVCTHSGGMHPDCSAFACSLHPGRQLVADFASALQPLCIQRRSENSPKPGRGT